MGFQKLIDDYDEHNGGGVRDTSREAYHNLISHPFEIHGRQLEVLKAVSSLGHPVTDQEIKSFLGKREPNYVRPRRFELVTMGLLSCNVKRHCKITGKRVYTWFLTKIGVEYLKNNGGL